MTKSDVEPQKFLRFGPPLKRRGAHQLLRLPPTVAQSNGKDPRVAKVIALMKEDISRELSLSNMAQSVNLSLTHFSCLFRSETGLPPARFLRLLRMHEATVLLSTTFLSIKQVVARVGFSDESHFVRDFKTMFGTGPTAFRKRKFRIPPVQLAVTDQNKKIG